VLILLLMSYADQRRRFKLVKMKEFGYKKIVFTVAFFLFPLLSFTVQFLWVRVFNVNVVSGSS